MHFRFLYENATVSVNAFFFFFDKSTGEFSYTPIKTELVKRKREKMKARTQL